MGYTRGFSKYIVFCCINHARYWINEYNTAPFTDLMSMRDEFLDLALGNLEIGEEFLAELE